MTSIVSDIKGCTRHKLQLQKNGNQSTAQLLDQLKHLPQMETHLLKRKN